MDRAPSDPETAVLELTNGDFVTIGHLMGVLENASSISGVDSIEIHATVNGENIVVGWGESAEPTPACSCRDAAAVRVRMAWSRQPLPRQPHGQERGGRKVTGE